MMIELQPVSMATRPAVAITADAPTLSTTDPDHAYVMFAEIRN